MAPEAPPDDAVPPILDLPERRLVDPDGTQRSADAQAAQITRRWNDWRRGDRVVAQLIGSRNSRVTEGADYLAVETRGRRLDQPLVARDEWLLSVRELAARWCATSSPDGFEVVPVPELDDRVFTVRRAKGRAVGPDGGPGRRRLPRRRGAPAGRSGTVRDRAPLPGADGRGGQGRLRPGAVAGAGSARRRSSRAAPGSPSSTPGITDQVRTDGWLAERARRRATSTSSTTSPRIGLLDPGAGHGTFVAGVIEQIAPRRVVDVHRALDSDGLGGEAAAASAMVRAAKAGATIINLSFGHGDRRRPAAAGAGRRRRHHPHPAPRRAPRGRGRQLRARPAVLAGGVQGRHRRRRADPDARRRAVVQPRVVGRRVDDRRGACCPRTSPATSSTATRTRPTAWAVWSGTSFAAPQIVAAVALLVPTRRGPAPVTRWPGSSTAARSGPSSGGSCRSCRRAERGVSSRVKRLTTSTWVVCGNVSTTSERSWW